MGLTVIDRCAPHRAARRLPARLVRGGHRADRRPAAERAPALEDSHQAMLDMDASLRGYLATGDQFFADAATGAAPALAAADTQMVTSSRSPSSARTCSPSCSRSSAGAPSGPTRPASCRRRERRHSSTGHGALRRLPRAQGRHPRGHPRGDRGRRPQRRDEPVRHRGAAGADRDRDAVVALRGGPACSATSSSRSTACSRRSAGSARDAWPRRSPCRGPRSSWRCATGSPT